MALLLPGHKTVNNLLFFTHFFLRAAWSDGVVRATGHTAARIDLRQYFQIAKTLHCDKNVTLGHQIKTGLHSHT
jgi:hypothetical protein